MLKSRYFARVPQAPGRAIVGRSGGVMPLGVTGNTSDSGSEESWFEPRRGNLKRVKPLGWLAFLLR